MTERRTLTAAVNTPIAGVDAEIVRSFVTQRPVTVKSNAAPASVVENQSTSVQKSNPNIQKQDTTERSIPRPPARFQRVGLIPVTVRLRPEIAGALKRASLERELDGEQVFTQQELVEQVLEPWLFSQGYLA